MHCQRYALISQFHMLLVLQFAYSCGQQIICLIDGGRKRRSKMINYDRLKEVRSFSAEPAMLHSHVSTIA